MPLAEPQVPADRVTLGAADLLALAARSGPDGSTVLQPARRVRLFKPLTQPEIEQIVTLMCVNIDTQGYRSPPRLVVPLPFPVPRTGSRPKGPPPATHAGDASRADEYPGFMAMSPGHVDLHRMVDRLDPDQVRALRAVAQQLPRPSVRHPDSGEAPEPESQLADEPVRDFCFTGLFNGAPDLSERSEEIPREEFAKRADASLPSIHRG